MASIVCACGRQVPTQPDRAGQWIICPGCDGSLYAPFPGDKPSAPTSATRLCALCAETIPVSEARCRYCGNGATAARPVPTSSDDGLPVLIVGLIGIMLCQLAAPAAWVMGSAYEARCRARGEKPSSTGHAGKIVGIVGTVMLGLGFPWAALSLGVRCR
jgi:hypothetical protein